MGAHARPGSLSDVERNVGCFESKAIDVKISHGIFRNPGFRDTLRGFKTPFSLNGDFVMSRAVNGIAALFGGGFVLLWIAAVVGWIANIVQIFRVDGPLTESATWTTLMVVKAIGILAAPVGSVMGWIGFFA
jgi:hypothetical protein